VEQETADRTTTVTLPLAVVSTLPGAKNGTLPEVTDKVPVEGVVEASVSVAVSV